MGNTVLDFSKQRDLQGLNQMQGEEQGRFEYASVGARFLASLIDGMIYQGCSKLIMAFFEAKKEGAAGMGPLFISIGLALVVYCIPMYATYGQTLGKKVLKIRVVTQDGSELGLGKIILRETLGKFLSVMILFIGYLMAFFDSEKKALHDRIAKTYVVKVQDT